MSSGIGVCGAGRFFKAQSPESRERVQMSSDDQGPWSSATLKLDKDCRHRSKRVFRGRAALAAAQDAGPESEPASEDNPWDDVLSDPWRDVMQESASASGGAPSREVARAGSGTVNLCPRASDLALVGGVAKAGDRRCSKYQQNGMDPEKVRNRWAKGICRCGRAAKGCQQRVPLHELQLLCQLYWRLSDEERALLIRTCYACAVSRGPGSSAAEDLVQGQDPDDIEPSRTTKWEMCGVPVCFTNFVHLLGTSSRMVSKQIKGIPDLRKSLDGAPAVRRAAPQAQHVDFFFAELYRSAAEPLPDPPSRSGTDGVIVLMKDCPWTDLEEADVQEWTPDNMPTEQFVALTVGCHGAGSPGVPVRYLQHGRLHDLYWLFSGTWDLLNVQSPESLHGVATPSFTLFSRRWQVWKKFLRFRKSSQHAQCQTCFELQQRMNKRNNSWHDRVEAARALKVHYHNQYLDRCIYWSMRFASRSGADVLCICIDTMDKAKFSWPRFGYGRLSKKLEGIVRPRTVFTAALAHGYGTYLYMAREEQTHGSDAFCEVLCFTRLAARVRLLGGGQLAPLAVRSRTHGSESSVCSYAGACQNPGVGRSSMSSTSASRSPEISRGTS